MIEKTVEGIKVLLGQTALENWSLLDLSDPSFIWMHLKSFPSGYVIVCHPEPTKEVLFQAAKLCHQHTKYKNLRQIKISKTHCSNVKKGDKPGEATFVSNRKVSDFKLY